MNQIVTAAEADGLDVTAYKDYSGRGMYGEKTSAVVSDGLPAFLVAVCEALRAAADPDAFVAEMWGVRTDNLGGQIVIY